MNPIIKNIDKYFRIIFLRKKKIISPIIFIILLGKIFMTTLVVQDHGTSCEYFSSLGTLFLFVLIVLYLAIMYFGP